MHWINPVAAGLEVIEEEKEEEIFAEILPVDEFSIQRRKKALSPLTSFALSSTITKPKKPLKTSQRITDATLDPKSKKLRVRLDCTIDHFPERQKIPKAWCGMHR